MDHDLSATRDFELDSTEHLVEGSEHAAPKRKISLKPIIRHILYATAFLVPLFIIPWTSEFLELNKQALLVLAAGVGLVLFLVEAIQNGAVKLKTSRLYLPMVALVVASIVSAVLSKNMYQSLLGVGNGVQAFSLATVLALVVLFFLFLNVIDDGGEKLKKIGVLSLTITLLVSVISVFGLFLIKKAPFNSYNFNTLGSLNSLAILAALMLPLFLETKFKLFKYLDVSKIAIGFALFLIILVNWWVVWVAAFVSLLAWMGFKILETGQANMKTYIFPMLVVVLGALLMMINFSMPVLKSRLAVDVSPSFKTSVSIALATLKEKPVSGYGLGEYGLAYDKYKPKSIAQTIFARTHFNQSSSSVLTLVSEGGVLMALALLFLLAMSASELYKARVRDSYLALAMLVFLFLFPFNISMIFWLFLALVLLELNSPTSSQKELVFEHSPKYSLIGSVAFIVGLVLVLASGYFVILRYAGDHYFVKAVQGKEVDNVISDFTKAININGQDAIYYRLLSQAVLIKLGNELNSKDSAADKDRVAKLQNLAASAVEIAKRATDMNPHDVENWLNRGLIYQNLIGLVGGADQAAVSMYQEALQRSPSDPAIYNNIGSIYLTIAENSRLLAANPPKGQNLNLDAIKKQSVDSFRMAEDNFKKAIELNNNYGQALFALGVVYEREGKLGDAIKQFEKLRIGNPNDPAIAFELGLLYYRNGQKEQAFNQLQQATTLFPDYSNARWYLSLLYEEKGDLANALAQVIEIQKKNPDNELVKQRLEQLQAGIRNIPPQKVLDQQPL